MLCDHAVARLKHSIVVFGGCTFKPGETFDKRFVTQSLQVIWTYNLYTDRWKRYVIPESEKVPVGRNTDIGCIGVTIKTDIYYMFGLANDNLATLWKLQKASKGGFSWSEVFVKKAPSYRCDMTGWEYAEKMWIFGGFGPSPADFENLNDFVDFDLDFHEVGVDFGTTNQLLCFDPSCCEWTNVKCCGTVPSPRAHCASAAIGNEAWLYGGYNSTTGYFNDLFKLNMNNLTWTEIQCKRTIPRLCKPCLIHGVSDSKLVLYGKTLKDERTTITYILDLSSLSWRKYTGLDIKSDQKGVAGLNSSVLIGGYRIDEQNYKSTLFVRVEPTSLQELAMKTIYEHKATLPLKLLPKKLLSKLME